MGRIQREMASGQLCLGLGSGNVFLFLSSQRKKVALSTDVALSHLTLMPSEPDCALLLGSPTCPEWPGATRGRSAPGSENGPAVQETEQGEGTGLCLRSVENLVKGFVGHRQPREKQIHFIKIKHFWNQRTLLRE